eukprot:TRINITY_DN1487_c0_g1_i2.p1 TRINITY_DN1487_c0_g1~~TRINITY_DN1487_c0_g1_i2.p1  ORF type:complete len:182 (-),score=31.15 TRINITY_DN1487_c0_g1_i2:276-821(-)
MCIRDSANTMPNKRVLELGGGCHAVPGIAAYLLGAQCTVTEQSPTVSLLELNVLNVLENFGPGTDGQTTGSLQAKELDWNCDKDALDELGGFDILLASDCVYEPLYGKSWQPLVRVMRDLSHENTIALVAIQRRNNDGAEDFLDYASEWMKHSLLDTVAHKEEEGGKEETIEIYQLQLRVE